jgi:SAM-dependent methyltransferase
MSGMDSRSVRRLPTYVYLQELLRGRRVLELGAGEGHSAHFLLRAGAKSVVAIEPASRLAEAARQRYKLAGLDIKTGDYGALELDEKSFDAVCVPGAGEILRRRGVLDEIKRVLAPDGVALFAVPSADRPDARGGLSYHELTERLGAAFGSVRMVGVSPFVGFSMVEFGDEATELTEIDLDTQLAQLDTPGGEAGVITDYVALCNAPAEKPRGYTVIQLPVGVGLQAVAEAQGPVAVAAMQSGTSEVPGEDWRRRVSRLTDERAQLLAEVAALRARASETELELGRVTALAAKEVGSSRAEAASARQSSQDHQEQMIRLRREILTLRAELDAHSAMGALGVRAPLSAQTEPGPSPGEDVAYAENERQTSDTTHVAVLAQARAEVESLTSELNQVRAERDAARHSLDDEQVAVANCKQKLDDVRAELEHARLELRDHEGQDVMLRDATSEIERLRGELARVRAELDEAEHAPIIEVEDRSDVDVDDARSELAAKEVARLTGALEKAREAAEQARSEAEFLRAEQGHLRAENQKALARAKEAQLDAERANTELGRARQQLVRLAQDPRASTPPPFVPTPVPTSGAGEDSKADPPELWESALRHEREMTAVRAELDERDAYIEELREEHAGASARQAELGRQLAAAEARAAGIDQELRAMRSRLALAEGHALRHKLAGNGAGAHAAVSSGGTMVAVSSAPVAMPPRAMPSPGSGDKARIAELERTLAAERKAAAEAQARWREAEGKTAELAAELRSARTSRVDDTGKQLAACQEQLARAQRDKAEIDKQAGELRGRLDKIWQERDAAIAAASAESDAVRRERDATVAAVRGELELMHAGAARRKAQVDRLEARVAELERELSALRKR